uniref:Oxidative stress 3 n=1 Tax=Opuntia streptacantha TaxID=393608 RepID=A0A7C8Z254_OPUST
MELVQEHKEQGSSMVRMCYREATCDQDEKMMMPMMARSHHVVVAVDDDMYISDHDSSSSKSYDDGSTISKESSSSSSELLDDASTSSSSSPQSSGPLYELSELMNQLPIKRGLSKYYQGKSQSFTSLAKVTSLEDLAKKETPHQRKLKACRSYGGGLNNFRSYTQPKPTISKKNSKGSPSNLSCLSRKGSFIGSPKPPLCPLQSSF